MTALRLEMHVVVCLAIWLCVAGCPQYCTEFTYTVPNDGDYSSGDGTVQFTVFTQDGIKRVLFRGQFVDVVDGLFYAQKGDIGGTDCPADGYTLCGHFINSQTAQGKYTPLRDCGHAGPEVEWTAALCQNPCEEQLNAMLQQASAEPNQVLEAEHGSSDGQQMIRSNASNAATILLTQGQSITFLLDLAEESDCTFTVPYSNDGPGTTDRLSLAVGSHTETLQLAETRGDCPAGEGWDKFCLAGPTLEPVTLAAGQHQVTLTLTHADAYGAEIDALLVLVTPAAKTCVESVEGLRAAIADSPADATICVAAGTYIVSESIEIARDDVTIVGQGDTTVFQLAEGVRCPVFIIGEPTPFAPTTTRSGIVLKSMRIRGYRSSNPQPSDELCSVFGREYLRNNCITVRQASDCTIEDVTLENAASGGVVLEQTCRNITLKGIKSSGHEFDGIACDGDIQNSRIENCTLHDNDGAGLSFDIGPANNVIIGCTVRDNAKVGVFIRDSRANTFEDCTISGNGEDGVFIADGDNAGAAATDNLFTNNQYRNNGRHGIWQAGANSTGNQVQGGTICGSGATAIEESFPATAPLAQAGVATAATCP